MIIDDLLNSVANALAIQFPDSTIRVDSLPQGYEEHDIFIIPINVERTMIRSSHWHKLSHRLDIQYFIDSKYDGSIIGEDIMDNLEYIDFVDDLPIRGYDMSTNHVDGVQHILITYDIDVRTPMPKDSTMETLRTEGNVKNGKN